jgi:plastocyanin
MHPGKITGALALLLAASACDSNGDLTTPASLARGVAGRTIQIRDACDPATFNAALGAGTCVGRSGGITFATFQDALRRTGTVAAWQFDPPEMTVAEGTEVPVVNVGGEGHTFTEVEEFGGGVVDLLNQLSGNPEMAPECANALPGGLIAPGDRITEEFDEAGEDEKYQCCIHPWMRTTVHVH